MKRYHYLCCLGYFVLIPVIIGPKSYGKDADAALDQDRLWLPIKHQRLFLDLKQAAQSALSLERCIEVMAGTIDEDRSAADHPMFRILCKQVSGKSYNELVDGKTYETLTTVVVKEVPLTEEEKHALRLAEEQRLEQERIAEEKRIAEEREAREHAFWQRCEQEAKIKTRLMKGVVFYTDPKPEPSAFDDDSARYRFLVDAVSIDDAPLYFSLDCYVTAEYVHIKVKRRQQSMIQPSDAELRNQ